MLPKKIEQIVTKPDLEFLYQLLKVVWHFIDMFSIRVWSMKLFNLKTLVVQSTLKVNVKQANVCTNGNAVGWLNKYVCRGGKNTICFLPTFHQICKVDQREIHLRRRKNILIQLWHFVFIELWSDYCLPLSKTHWLTHSCVLGLNYMTPGDDYAKSKLEVIGSLMTFVICKVKSNSCNPCVCLYRSRLALWRLLALCQ